MEILVKLLSLRKITKSRLILLGNNYFTDDLFHYFCVLKLL